LSPKKTTRCKLNLITRSDSLQKKKNTLTLSLSLSLPLCLARMTRNEDIQEIDIDELPEDPWDEITLHLIHDSKIDQGTYYFSLSQPKPFFFMSYFSFQRFCKCQRPKMWKKEAQGSVDEHSK
jgi:hypothetical protein